MKSGELRVACGVWCKKCRIEAPAGLLRLLLAAADRTAVSVPLGVGATAFVVNALADAVNGVLGFVFAVAIADS